MTYKTDDQINKEFDEKFFQDRTGEKCEGWLAMKTDILTKGDYKIAIPNDLKSFIHQIRKEDRESLRELIERVDLKGFWNGYHPDAIEVAKIWVGVTKKAILDHLDTLE